MESNIQQIKELKQLYQNVFESPDGKKILDDLSRKCFINRTTLNESQIQMAFNEGQRSIVLHIQTMMRLDIDKIKEHLDKQEKENDNVE